jgi:hypothetical protein
MVGYSSVVEHLDRMHEVLGWDSSQDIGSGEKGLETDEGGKKRKQRERYRQREVVMMEWIGLNCFLRGTDRVKEKNRKLMLINIKHIENTKGLLW